MKAKKLNNFKCKTHFNAIYIIMTIYVGVLFMRKKREFIQGMFYHVTSRTNDKIRVFENRLGRKIMLMVLQDAKNKFHFNLKNFCIMPTHIHLLIKPDEGTSLKIIMQWIKTRSAIRWNRIHGSTDHLWGERYFARLVKDQKEYEFIMDYIDQNPVKAGLVPNPADWKASGAYYKMKKIPGLVDFVLTEGQSYLKLLSPIPPIVSRLLPPAQNSYILQYYGAYEEIINRLYDLVPMIPRFGETETMKKPHIYLHYFTGTADYFINEYDGYDTMYGKVRFLTNPAEIKFQKITLSDLKKNQYLQLDLSWIP